MLKFSILSVIITSNAVIGFGFAPVCLSNSRNNRYGASKVVMNDIGKRIQRLGKDKLDSASEWINEAADPNGINIR